MDGRYFEFLEAIRILNQNYDMGDEDSDVKAFLDSLPALPALPVDISPEIYDAFDLQQSMCRFLFLALALAVRYSPGAAADLRGICARAERVEKK